MSKRPDIIIAPEPHKKIYKRAGHCYILKPPCLCGRIGNLGGCLAC